MSFYFVLASDPEVQNIDAFIAQRRNKGNAGALGITSEDMMQVDQDVQGQCTWSGFVTFTSGSNQRI